jgi:integrase
MNFRKSLKKVSTGVYKNTTNGKFFAEKRINGKSTSKTFSNLHDAKSWRQNLANKPVHVKGVQDKVLQQSGFSTLKEVWEEMQKHHFPTLATSTRSIWVRRYELLKPLELMPMNMITPSKFTTWVNHWVSHFSTEEYKYSGRGKAGRCNLNMELNMFVTIFNWYKESEQFEHEAMHLTCPVRKKHRKLGFIKPVPDKKKQINLEHALTFFKYLKPLYRDLAMMQFFCAGRIGEVAGMQWSNIDLDNDRLLIKHTCIWDMTLKTFVELKPFPKNKEARPVFITDEIREILKRRTAFKVTGCDYVFHVEGKPLNYATIQVNYRGAQRKGKLPYSGTHILRHGMAKLARQVGGGLDAVIAMTGHKDLKLADHYSKCNEDDQKQFSQKIMQHIKKVTHGGNEDSLNKEEVLVPVSSFDNVVSLSDFKKASQ